MEIGGRAGTSAQGSALLLCASGHVGWEQGHFLTLEKQNENKKNKIKMVEYIGEGVGTSKRK